MRKTHEAQSHTVTYNDDEATKQRLFDTVMAFFKKHHCYAGESIYQCDAPQVEAPELLTEIAEEVLQFEVKWDE